MTAPDLSAERGPRFARLHAIGSATYALVLAFVVLFAFTTTVAVGSQYRAPHVVGRAVPVSTIVRDARQHTIASATIDTAHLEVRARLRDGKTLVATFPSPYTKRLTMQLVASRASVRNATVSVALPGPTDRSARGHHATPSGWLWILPGGLWALAALLVLGEVLRLRHRKAQDQLDELAMSSETARSSGIASSLMRTGVPSRTAPSARAATARTGVPRTGVTPIAERPKTRFCDVAGAEEAVADLAEIVTYLREPERFTALGATLPRGALLCGPPGTGKTLLARAVAGEAEIAFFSAKASDFDNTYVGAGAGKVRDLFQAARTAQPSIVFLDEVDSLGRRRSGAPGGGEERANTLNALLAEMDGFEAKDAQVVVLAATNLPDLLDPALVRPGRLSRKIAMGLPDRRGREAILAVHMRSRPIAGDVDRRALAGRTPGMSGAELAEVVNEACLEAARRERRDVDASCFESALATVAMGRARLSAVVSDADREITAWHEAGHTVVAMCTPGAAPPVAVSILPRGQAGGVTWMSGRDDQYLSVSAARAQLAVALGGRVGEELLLGSDFTSGAANDLEQATGLAQAMAARFGMTDLGLAVRDERLVAGAEATRVVEKVESLLAGAHDDARAVLEAQRPLLEAIVAELLAEDTLDAAQLAVLRARHCSA